VDAPIQLIEIVPQKIAVVVVGFVGDRDWRHRPAQLAENAHASRYVLSGSDQEPCLPGHRLHNLFAEGDILIGVAGAVFEDHAGNIQALLGKKQARNISLAEPCRFAIQQTGAAAENQFRARI